ncbi:MAG: C45 family autoproteolytic acyltransferase/hydrolase [Bacillota bacterium]|nr:C45 family autoproteolytic acyltransferase/hydrolase [Bacillota bacterium]
MTKKIYLILAVFVFTLTIFSGCGDKVDNSASAENVAIKNKENYFEVKINLAKNNSHLEIGKEYAKEILKAVPDYEEIVDSYLAEVIGSKNYYDDVLKRVKDIKPQIEKDYSDEITGMGSVFSGSTDNQLGDGKLSTDEIYIMNLLPDVLRLTQCSALGIYGKRSETNSSMMERALDWYAGAKNQLAKVQAVTYIENNSKSICTIGFLGYIGVISGYNRNQDFAAILDSSTGGIYYSEGRRSYTMDLRYALENSDTIDKIADYLKSDDRKYTFGHLIFLCDKNTVKVLENNVGSDPNSIRKIRDEKSELNEGINWGYDNAIGCVNAFELKGNLNNHSNIPENVARWESMKNELKSKGDKISLDEFKEIASYHKGKYPGEQSDGDLYNVNTDQIIIYQPSEDNLEIFFRPYSGKLPGRPDFKKVPVWIQ